MAVNFAGVNIAFFWYFYGNQPQSYVFLALLKEKKTQKNEKNLFLPLFNSLRRMSVEYRTK
jgi:hypothetical protein